MKKAIFHSNLGGWGGIPCLGSKLRGQKKSKNMHENKHITNLLFTKKYEIWTARFFSMNTFAWHQNWKYLFLRWKVLTYIQISSVSVCIYMEDVCRCTFFVLFAQYGWRNVLAMGEKCVHVPLYRCNQRKSLSGDPPIFFQFYTRKYCMKVVLKGISSQIKMKNRLSLTFLLKESLPV